MTEIIPGLWIGSRLSAANKRNLRHHGIKAILNVAKNLPPPLHPNDGFDLYWVGLIDGRGNDPRQFAIAVQQLTLLMQQGSVTLVHCVAGVSRSAYIVARYLLAAGKAKDLDSAIEMIAAKRPKIWVNKALHNATIVDRL